MSRSPGEHSRIAEEAAEWCVRLRMEPDSDRARMEFDRWIRQGARNMEEFLYAQMMFKELDRLDASFDPASFEPNEGVVEFPTPPARRAEGTKTGMMKRSWARVGALAAAIVLAIAIAWVSWAPGYTEYSTRVGSQEAIKLDEGSVIHLNTRSKVKVQFSNERREVRLLEGEALFTVAHDPMRPFIVSTDSAQVRAIGTQFNVYRSNTGQTTVSVLEGAVQVTMTAAAASPGSSIPPSAPEKETHPAAIRLGAGDEAAVLDQQIVRTVAPDVERAVAWRARRLVFPDTDISQVADEFNRYNARQIRVEGADIRARKMTGVFDADDPEPMIRFLARDPNVEVVRSETEVLIRARR